MITLWVFVGGDPETGEIAGFVSAVQFRDDPDLLSVRARDAESLGALADLAGVQVISDWPDASDYPFRVFVSRMVFREWLTLSVDAINYGNFKNRVSETRGSKWSDALTRVWSAMIGVERAASKA